MENVKHHLRLKALVVKLFYLNYKNSFAAAKEFRRMKQIRRGPMYPCALRKMIQKFETTEQLAIIPGRRQKQISTSSVEDGATAVSEARSQSPHGSVSVPVIPVYCIYRIPMYGKSNVRF
ncbi:hypothetical protein AVEN_45785-1 [Araneus ventricosus]|uniref:DUF4817 domain-containing protein n=1 Tax=Araneus ventricosus TaxID=182803 RepID=A0A4Y2FE56_ARAVE|nr:hypothetical protein AVEN_45785-1 [Araneus ventricosus]